MTMIENGDDEKNYGDDEYGDGDGGDDDDGGGLNQGVNHTGCFF